MKKIFTLFTALLVVCAVSAEDWHITNETANIISTTVANASSGDVIYLGDGKYNQPEQISFDDKVLTILPEDGAKPIIPIHWYCELKNSAQITIKGIKFVGDELIYVKTPATYYEEGDELPEGKNVGDEKTPAVMMGASDHCFRPYDATDGKELRLENCEFKGFPDYVILSQRYNSSTAYPLDSIIINDCYFHENTKSCVIFCNQGTSTAEQLKGLIVKNSTIANNSTTADYSAIYVYNYNGTATSNIEVTVDHCTFYNNPTTNTDHSCVRSYKSTKVSISNCIFAHPTAIDFRATNCYGGTISNCLTYNLTKDSEKNGHRTEGGVPTLTGNFTADPLFTDAANGDFSYAGDWSTGEVSPARGAGTDGSDLGDPRWYTAEVLPNVAFSSPYALSGSVAQLKGNVWYDGENEEIYYNDKSENGIVTWKVHATRACCVTASYHNGYASGHNLTIEIRNAENSVVGSITAGSHSSVNDFDFSGNICFPEAGDYTIILSNSTGWSSAHISNLTLTLVSEEVTVGSTGWATFCSDNALNFSGLNVEAYIVTGHSGNILEKTQLKSTIPANTPLLLKADADSYVIPIVSSSETSATGNKLVRGTGSGVGYEEGKTRYVLMASGSTAEFQLLANGGASAIVGTNKAYLEFNEVISLAPSALRLENEENNATSIEEVNSSDDAFKFMENGKFFIKKNGVVYDMMGRVMR